MIRVFLIPLLLFSISQGYESEDKLKALLVGKVAKYITWQEENRDNFKITVLNGHPDDLFKKIYSGQKIKNKDVEVVYINTVEEIGNTDILFISEENAERLDDILTKTENKNIFLVSDIKGFAQKGGMMQLYFASQKIKLRINLDNVKKEELKIKSSLLRIADIVRED